MLYIKSLVLLVVLSLLPSLASAVQPPPPRRLVLINMDDVGRINMGFARALPSPWDATVADQPSTPTIDSIALAGMRAKNMMAGPNCMASRMKLLGMGESYRPTNLTGTVIGRNAGLTNPPWRTEVVINTSDNRSLFHRAKKHGYTTYGSGKMHFFTERYVKNMSSIGAALGMDIMPFGFDSTTTPYSLFDEGEGAGGQITGAQQSFLGANCHVNENLAGAQSLSSVYSNKEVMDHAVNHLQNVLGPDDTSKLFMYLAPHSPHSPNDSGATPADGCPSLLSRNDRPPGDTTSTGEEQVFNSQIEDLDNRISALRAQLDLDPVTGQDILCITSDNGIQGRGAKLISEIYRHPPNVVLDLTKGSQRWKSWPYPAGVQVPLVCEGKGIAANTTITANIGMPDLNKTIDAILSGGSGGGHLDGQSFASCLGSTEAADACEGQESICIQKFGTVGGVTDGLWPESPRDGEPLYSAGPDWNVNWNLCRKGGHWLVRWGGYEANANHGRPKVVVSFPDVAYGQPLDAFNEEFFNEDRTNDSQYFNPGDEIASTPFGFDHAGLAIVAVRFFTIPVNNDTLTLNGTVFTYKDTLTGADNEVQTNFDRAVVSSSLASAITNSSAAVSSLVTASSGTNTTSTTIAYNVYGAAGNAITISSSVPDAIANGVTTLLGGVDSEFGDQRKITLTDFNVTPTDAELEALAVLQRNIDMIRANGGNYGNRGGAF